MRISKFSTFSDLFSFNRFGPEKSTTGVTTPLDTPSGHQLWWSSLTYQSTVTKLPSLVCVSKNVPDLFFTVGKHIVHISQAYNAFLGFHSGLALVLMLTQAAK